MPWMSDQSHHPAGFGIILPEQNISPLEFTWIWAISLGTAFPIDFETIPVANFILKTLSVGLGAIPQSQILVSQPLYSHP